LALIHLKTQFKLNIYSLIAHCLPAYLQLVVFAAENLKDRTCQRGLDLKYEMGT